MTLLNTIQISRIGFFLSLVLSFILGAVIVYSTFNKVRSLSSVPDGIYTPLLSVSGASYQINLIDLDEDTGTMVAWVREDRSNWFESESKMPARTTFTKMAIHCTTSNIIILEQRVFGPQMQHVTTVESMSLLADISSLASVVTIVTACPDAPSEHHQEFKPSSSSAMVYI